MKQVIYVLLLLLISTGYAVAQLPVPVDSTQSVPPQNPATVSTTLQEVRLIPCSTDKISEVQPLKVVVSSALTVTSVTEETKVPPPASAVGRVNAGYTVRYFNQASIDGALLLQKKIKAHYGSAESVVIEDMRPYYNGGSGNPKLVSYLEVWIK